MRTAQEFINFYQPNSEYPSYYHESNIEQMINDARREAIEECMKQSQIICKEANYNGGNLKVEYCVDMDVFKLLIDELK